MDIRIPNLGEGVDSGTVAQIFAKVGSTVNKDDPLIELESEKAVATIPAPASGTITKIYVQQGDTVRVGQLICSLQASEADEKAAAAASPPLSSAATAAEARGGVKVGSPPAGIPVAASPTIRRMAREFGLELSQVFGSGRGGRITTADVRAYLQQLQQGGARPAASGRQIDFARWGKVQRKPMTQLRRVIAERVQEAAILIPHVTQFHEVDISVAWALREKYAAAYKKKGAHLTLTVFVIKAVVETLKKLPVFNTSLDEAAGEIVFKQYYHLGIAVDTEQGLMVPVVRDADKQTPLQLAKQLQQLAQKARARKLAAEEMQGGCFTISNQGSIGGAHFTPIINRPEVAILGLGRGSMKPAVVGKKIAPRLMLPVSLSYDHRVIDGASAARFVVEFAAAMQAFKEKDLKI